MFSEQTVMRSEKRLVLSGPGASAAVLTAFVSGSLTATTPPITLDGRFDDWADRAVTAIDATGDGGLDLTELRVADEPEWFQMLISASADFDLSDDNDLVLLLDTAKCGEVGRQDFLLWWNRDFALHSRGIGPCKTAMRTRQR